LFYFSQNTDDHLRVSFPPQAEDSNDNLIHNNSWAAFSQWNYALTDALSLSGGLRYTFEKKASTPFQFNLARPAVLYVPHRRYEKNFNATTGSASIQYRWNPSLMTYLSWTQGFKSGGFNSRFNAVVPGGAPPSFEPEHADSTELGMKLDVASRLRLNAAVFSTAYEDIQLTYRVGMAPFIFNAGKASIEGLDLELEYLPARGLILSAGLGYLNADIDSVSTIVGATTLVTTHSRLPYSPRLQGNASVSYSLPITSRLHATPRIDLAYTASQYFDTGNTVEIAQNDSVTLLNLGVMVDNQSTGWQLSFGVSNATNEIYPIAGNSSLTTNSGYAEIAYSRGREAFLSLTKSY
jgi:iron complex outermembrane receptor protein